MRDDFCEAVGRSTCWDLELWTNTEWKLSIKIEHCIKWYNHSRTLRAAVNLDTEMMKTRNIATRGIIDCISSSSGTLILGGLLHCSSNLITAGNTLNNWKNTEEFIICTGNILCYLYSHAEVKIRSVVLVLVCWTATVNNDRTDSLKQPRSNLLRLEFELR